jgi:phosphoribosyl-dephospho-CoA transferase
MYDYTNTLNNIRKFLIQNNEFYHLSDISFALNVNEKHIINALKGDTILENEIYNALKLNKERFEFLSETLIDRNGRLKTINIPSNCPDRFKEVFQKLLNKRKLNIIKPKKLSKFTGNKEFMINLKILTKLKKTEIEIKKHYGLH